MIGSFLHFILNGLISLMIWAIIISAIMSWLTAFNVINPVFALLILQGVQRYILPALLGGI